MATRNGDATILAYLQFIIDHQSQLPNYLLFIEHHSGTNLKSRSSLWELIQAGTSLWDIIFLVPNDVSARLCRFTDWSEPSESTYAKAMYDFLASELGLDPTAPPYIDTLNEATFLVCRELITRHPGKLM
ncbi:Protein of unknown function [Pyronema omphalodes CBS 100304]|uniref:Uncharacterized protein n=1 Tax=Pyronema omphalodes (strain CBS 100304) TaxID=1076935 RepID=U4LYI3_PYROM|nr:Protein of unknown function [Pyronema omphalodes CBS 100304]